MRAAGAAIDFVTGHHVQRKRLVCYRLFQQDETAVRRGRRLGNHRKKRDRRYGSRRTLHLVRVYSLNGNTCVLIDRHDLIIGYFVKFKLTGRPLPLDRSLLLHR